MRYGQASVNDEPEGMRKMVAVYCMALTTGKGKHKTHFPFHGFQPGIEAHISHM
jgi:hypothetical protein